MAPQGEQVNGIQVGQGGTDEPPMGRVVRFGPDDYRLWIEPCRALIPWHGFELHAEVKLDDRDQPYISDFRVINNGDGEPITGALLRRIPMPELLNRIVDIGTKRVSFTKPHREPDAPAIPGILQYTLAPADGSPPITVWVDMADQNSDRSDPNRASVAVRRLHDTKREAIEDEARQVAELYNRALRDGDRAPILRVERELRGTHLQMGRRTVQRRVDVARELGLIEEEQK